MAITLSHDQLAELINALRTPGGQGTGGNQGHFGNCTSRFNGEKRSNVEAFISAITAYKECVGVSDGNALKGLCMLLTDGAATWWRVVKADIKSFDEALERLRLMYGVRVPPYKKHRKLVEKEQQDGESTEAFVGQGRVRLSQLPVDAEAAREVEERYNEQGPETTEATRADEALDRIRLMYDVRVPPYKTHRKLVEKEQQDGKSTEAFVGQGRARLSQLSVDAEAAREVEERYKEQGPKATEATRVGEARKKERDTVSEADAKGRPTSADGEMQKDTGATKKSDHVFRGHREPLACYGCGALGVIRARCANCRFDVTEASGPSKPRKRPILPVPTHGGLEYGIADTGQLGHGRNGVQIEKARKRTRPMVPERDMLRRDEGNELSETEGMKMRAMLTADVDIFKAVGEATPLAEESMQVSALEQDEEVTQVEHECEDGSSQVLPVCSKASSSDSSNGVDQIIFRSGVLSQLEAQRDERLASRVVSLQAHCRGYLARKRLEKRKVQDLAILRCVQRKAELRQEKQTKERLPREKEVTVAEKYTVKCGRDDTRVDLEQLVGPKKQLEKKLSDDFEEVEEPRQVVGQWKRKVQKLNGETNDRRRLLEEQNARINVLEKKQLKFDAETQLPQDELRQEKQTKERLAREKEVAVAEKYTVECDRDDTRGELELKDEKLDAQEREQDRRRRYADIHRRPAPEYQEDVMLVKTHLLSDAAKGRTAKFLPKRYGPFVVRRVVTPTSVELGERGDPATTIGRYYPSEVSPFVGGPTVSSPTRPKRKRGRLRKNAI